MKPIAEVTETVADERTLLRRMEELSRTGGAWVYSVLPFSHTVTFSKYANRAAVPDQYFDLSRGRIGWRGAIVPFTPAARIREQNRGLGRE